MTTVSVRCKYCPTRIIWTRHWQTRKAAPIEDEASPNGNVRFEGDGDTYRILTGEALENAREAGEHLHLNHFAACPGASKARRR